MENFKSKVNFVKEIVNDFLRVNGKLSELIRENTLDSFKINILEIFSKEELIKLSNIENFQECFGLSYLLSI